MNGPFMDTMWTDSFRRMDYSTNEPVVDGSLVDGPRVDGPKKPHGTQLIIMWSPRNPKWK